MNELTPKQARFVDEYLIDLNATQAAIRAGYSAKTADVQGPRLLGNVGVATAIAERQDARAERTGITSERVLAELAKIGFANIADVTDWGTKEVAFGYDEDGKRLKPEDIGDAAVVRYVEAPFVVPVNRDDLAPDLRAAVSEVSLGRDGFKIKMHDKVGALTLIARHLGMLVDKTELTGPGGGPVRVQQEVVAAVATLSPEERATLRALAMKLEKA